MMSLSLRCLIYKQVQTQEVGIKNQLSILGMFFPNCMMIFENYVVLYTIKIACVEKSLTKIPFLCRKS